MVVVQVSRLEDWKGHRVLLAGLSQLRDVPNWTCWIAGGAQLGSERRYLDELKNAVRRNGIADRVRFLGERDDVPGALWPCATVVCATLQPVRLSDGLLTNDEGR